MNDEVDDEGAVPADVHCVNCGVTLKQESTWVKDHNEAWVCCDCFEDDVATGDRYDHKEDER